MNPSSPSPRPAARVIRRAWAVVALTAAALAMAAPGRATGYTVQAINYEYVAPGSGSSLTVSIGDQVT